MPDNHPNPLLPYVPLLMQLLVAGGIATGMIILSAILGKRKWSRAKMQPYECGITPTGDAQHRFSVKFYLVAMLFILFDVEAIFLYPWAVVFKQLKMFGFVEMLTFVVLILAGFFFIGKKGVLDWAQTEIAPGGY